MATLPAGFSYNAEERYLFVLDEQGTPLSHHPFDVTQTIRLTLQRVSTAVWKSSCVAAQAAVHPFSGVAGKTGTSNDNRDSWLGRVDNSRLSIVWVVVMTINLPGSPARLAPRIGTP